MRQNKAFFGVILRVYNHEKYVKNAIESVVNQIYDDWLLYIIDDGSDDNSSDICIEMSKDNDKICYIQHENMGCVLSTLDAIKRIDCEYIAILDADDWYDECYLENSRDIIDRNNGKIDVIINGLTQFSDNYKFINENRLSEYDLVLNRHDGIRFIFCHSAYGINLKVVRKSIVQYDNRIENFFLKNGFILNSNEDFFQTLPVMLNVKDSVYVSSLCLYNYRISPMSISQHTNIFEKIFCLFLAMDYCIKVFSLYSCETLEYRILCFNECHRCLSIYLSGSYMSMLGNPAIKHRLEKMKFFNLFKASLNYRKIASRYGLKYAIKLKKFMGD